MARRPTKKHTVRLTRGFREALLPHLGSFKVISLWTLFCGDLYYGSPFFLNLKPQTPYFLNPYYTQTPKPKSLCFLNPPQHSLCDRPGRWKRSE